MKTGTRVCLAVVTALAVGLTAGCMPPRYIALGTTFWILPDGYVQVVVGGRPYYYHRGIFLRPVPRGFIVVHPPRGAEVPRLPPGHVWIDVAGERYAYAMGVFYAWYPQRRQHVVVAAPMGARVPSLPGEATAHRIDGILYKEYAGAWYRVVRRGGTTEYQVVPEPRGRR